MCLCRTTLHCKKSQLSLPHLGTHGHRGWVTLWAVVTALAAEIIVLATEMKLLHPLVVCRCVENILLLARENVAEHYQKMDIVGRRKEMGKQVTDILELHLMFHRVELAVMQPSMRLSRGWLGGLEEIFHFDKFDVVEQA